MKETMMKLLLELLKDSSRSDRKLAKILGVSQATVTRMRHKLVEERLIQEFTVIPDFVKLGYEIIAITCVKVKESMILELEEKAKEYMMKTPNIIFAGGGAQGMGKNGVMISLHRNYSDLSNFLTNHMIYWGENIEEHFTILVSLKERIVKPFSLKYITQLEEGNI